MAITPQARLRLRRHWRMPAVFAVVVVALIVLGAGVRVRPLVARGGSLPPDQTTENILNSIDLFDPEVVHRIEVTVDEEDRRRMIETYRESNEKIVIDAALRIDGVTVHGSGVRLKGNSSLSGIFDGGPGGDGQFDEFDRILNDCLAERGVTDEIVVDDQGDDQAQGDDLESGDDVESGHDLEPGDGEEFPADGDFFGEGFDGEFPESVHPGTGDDFAASYLLVLNHHNPDQRYQGLAELALRIDGGATLLAEPVSLAAHRLVGMPAPRTTMTGFSINDEPELLYGLTAVMDQAYVDGQLGGVDGVLYKASADQSQNFEYDGVDESHYDGFRQVTSRKRHDKQPLIELIRFVNQEADDVFARDFATRVDVDAMARLLAMNNLLVNTDSLGTGPGGNYYLFYDAAQKRFTPLGWDFNFSLGGLDGFITDMPVDPLTASTPWLGPGEESGEDDAGDDEDSTGEVDPFDYCLAKADEATADLGVDGDQFEEEPAGLDEQFESLSDDDADATGEIDVDDPAMWMHPLVVRFLKVPEFRERYEAVYREMYDELLASGELQTELERQVAVVDRAVADRPSLADTDRLAGQNRTLQRFLDGRTTWLKDNLPAKS